MKLLKLIHTVIILLLFFSVYPAYSKLHPLHDITTLRQNLALGKTTMSVSTIHLTAKEHFLLGLSFLHSFMYDLAIDQFQQAQKLDPGFAMAYWGEAMANKHPLWSDENVSQAQAILKRYLQQKTKHTLSIKEKYYLRAAMILFGDKPRLEREREYNKYMSNFYQQYPNDPDVGAFYTLALLGFAAYFPKETLSKHYVIDGRKLITQLFKQFPSHPGIVHYYIHYYDVEDKAFAEQALPAADIALNMMHDSSHVTHMSSHIYRRLAKWDAFNQANQFSIQAADKLCKQLNDFPLYACNAENKYHSMEWLHYGYLQKKQFNKASALVDILAKIVKQDNAVKYKQWYYSMWARQLLATKNWHANLIKIQPIAQPDAGLYWNAYAECGGLLANGLALANRHQSTKAVINRLNIIILYTSSLSDPYIKQTCQVAKFKILAETANQHNNKKLAHQSIQQALIIQKQQIATETTPSLAFLTT